MKCKAIVVHQIGGPEVLSFEDVEVPQPGPGQALVRHRAIGLNFVDIYVRSGVYPPPSLPYTPGTEGAGVVEAVGANVSEVRVGDRVAYVGGPLGSYSEARVIPSRFLVKLPDKIDEATAAAAMLKGLTTEYLIHSTYAVKPGDTILLHAAAGGNRPDPLAMGEASWCDRDRHRRQRREGQARRGARLRSHDRLFARGFRRARKRNHRRKEVPVVYDSVGQTTFMKSLDCLRPRGLMVSFGQASGVVPPFSINILSAKGSLYLTRPTLATYTARREDLEAAARRLFDVLGSGAVRCEVKRSFKLADAAEAHRALGQRETTGSSILLP